MVWPSQEGSPLSAVQGTRGQRPWPSCRRPPWTAACTDAPSTMSMARPPLTSASAPKVRVPRVSWLLGGQQSSVERWYALQADQPKCSCALSFLSTQCCQDSSQEKRVKVWSPSGEEWVAFVPALPSSRRPSSRTWNLFQMPCLPPQTAALCLLVQGVLGEDAGGGLFQTMVGREVAKGRGVHLALCPFPMSEPLTKGRMYHQSSLEPCQLPSQSFSPWSVC